MSKSSFASVLICMLVAGRTARADNVFVDFKTLGTVTTSTLSIGLVDISADDGVSPAQVLMLNFNGLGVVGGAANSTTDGSEALHFQFQEPVANAAYHVGLANNLNGNGLGGEHSLEAFVGATSLGVMALDDVGWKNVSALFGGVAVTSFSVRASGDGNRIDAMEYATLEFQTYCTAKTNSQGCVPQIGATGTASIGDMSALVVTSTQELNKKNGLFFYSVFGRTAVPFLGGTLCAQPPLKRTAVTNSGGTALPAADCSGGYSFDLEAWFASGADPNLSLGTTIDGQFWSRDPQGTFGAGLTDAIEVTLTP